MERMLVWLIVMFVGGWWVGEACGFLGVMVVGWWVEGCVLWDGQSLAG